MNKERDEPEPTIIEQLDDEFRKLSPNPYEYLSVEFIAARMHVDQFTLQHWMEKDTALKEGLENCKENVRKRPMAGGRKNRRNGYSRTCFWNYSGFRRD